jgi:hypothetical protein
MISLSQDTPVKLLLDSCAQEAVHNTNGCFKLLNLGVICCAVIENHTGLHSISNSIPDIPSEFLLWAGGWKCSSHLGNVQVIWRSTVFFQVPGAAGATVYDLLRAQCWPRWVGLSLASPLPVVTASAQGGKHLLHTCWNWHMAFHIPKASFPVTGTIRHQTLCAALAHVLLTLVW